MGLIGGLFLLLAGCGGGGTDSNGNSAAPSVAAIEEEAGGVPAPELAPRGVVPVVYTGEDKVLADRAPEGMAYIKGGCFTMGNNNAQADEKLAHPVCVDGFFMDRYEVTQKRWEAVMGYNPSKFTGPDLPVEQVNFPDIQDFIKRSGGTCRLPSEAEWEYAAGANLVRTRYYWGNLMDGEYAWFKDNSGGITHPGGSKKPNQYGLYDMMGNVWEWTEDWYAPNYSPEKVTNPTGPNSGEYRVIRGGGLDTTAGGLRITNRTWLHPKNRVYTKITTYGGIVNEIFNYIGFRCVRDLDSLPPANESPPKPPQKEAETDSPDPTKS
ncbi:MAG: formylglycine-generating enzyme family protein [Nitrospinaceae bacterium]